MVNGRVRGNDAEDGSGGFERTLAQPNDFREKWLMNRDYIVERHVMICVSRGPEVGILTAEALKKRKLEQIARQSMTMHKLEM